MTSVLFVRLSAMGDLVQGLGAIAALHAARPDWRLTVVTQAPFAPLLAGMPGLARVVTFERRGGLPAVRALRNALRTEPCDVALDLQGNWKSAFVALLSGARERLGAAGPWRREPASRWLLHRAVAPSSRHPAAVAAALVRELVPGLAVGAPRLVATPAEVAAEAAAVRTLGIDPGQPFRVLVVTDPRDSRALRPEQLAAFAAAERQPVLQLLGPAEVALPPAVAAPTLRHGRGELRRLVALGALVAAARGEVLGPDQGASHVLAAAGARVAVCFGAQDPDRTGPPAAARFVHAAPPPCAPCHRLRCQHPSGPVCMDFRPETGRALPPLPLP